MMWRPRVERVVFVLSERKRTARATTAAAVDRACGALVGSDRAETVVIVVVRMHAVIKQMSSRKRRMMAPVATAATTNSLFSQLSINDGG